MVNRIHPLPHGLQRSQVQWHWVVKPLQPSRGTPEGGAWDIGTEVAPPPSVLPAFGKDVLLTLLKNKNEPDKGPAMDECKHIFELSHHLLQRQPQILGFSQHMILGPPAC